MSDKKESKILHKELKNSMNVELNSDIRKSQDPDFNEDPNPELPPIQPEEPAKK